MIKSNLFRHKCSGRKITAPWLLFWIPTLVSIWCYIISKRLSYDENKTTTHQVLGYDIQFVVKYNNPKIIWVRSRNCGCLVTWFCYQLIAKPGNKTATVPWPDPNALVLWCLDSWLLYHEFREDWRLLSTGIFQICYIGTMKTCPGTSTMTLSWYICVNSNNG